MKVLIIGAGIGGLALAAHLRRSGHTVEIVEKAKKLENAGFVLGLWAVGLRTLMEFGVLSKIKEVGHYPTRFSLRRKDGKLLRRFDFTPLLHNYGPAVLLLRSDFQKILLEINRETDIKLGCSITDIIQSSSTVEVTFTTGNKGQYDLVVGADGIHSQVRHLIFGEEHVQYSGFTSWLFMTNKSTHYRPNVTEIWSGKRFFGIYPFLNNRICVIFAAKSNKKQYDGFEDKSVLIKKLFSDFGWIAKDIVDSLDSRDHITHTDWEIVNIPTWHKGKVVLIGDAAHSMLPTAGSGASLALEDAYVLSQQINLYPQDLAMALKSYEEKRKKAASALRRHTDFLAKIVALDGTKSYIRDNLIRFVPKEWVQRDLQYLMSAQRTTFINIDYKFKSSWEIRGQLSKVRRQLEDFESWPMWWKAVKEISRPSPHNIECVFGYGPYNLKIYLEITGGGKNDLKIKVTGDLFGTGEVKFKEKSDCTLIDFIWKVGLAKESIYQYSQALHSIFAKAHEEAMTWGARGLAEQLNTVLVKEETKSI